MLRRVCVLVVCAVGIAGCARLCGESPPSRPVAPPRAAAVEAAASDRPPTLVLVVLDTVRADHLSMCDYPRPTSPFLDSLARPGRAVWTCEAVAPGSWTVPSHASFFTGQAVAEHGVDGVDRHLPATVPTLAEDLRARGYQTVLVSANPTLGPSSGLTRGFDAVHVAPGSAAWRGDELQGELRRALAALDPERPLFLVLNVFDAHDPFAAIPAGLGWVEAQPRIAYGVHKADAAGVYHSFVRGRLVDSVATEFVREVTDAYDHGISLADSNISTALGRLAELGWTRSGFRVVITSDHGEYLGERDRLRHGCELDQAVVQVPLLVYGRGTTIPESLPRTPSGRQVFWLVRDGTLAPEPVATEAFSVGRPEDPRRCADVAAAWTGGGRKVVWRAEATTVFELRSDPTESQPQPATDAEARAIAERVSAWRVARDAMATQADARRREELDALGY